jgi:hypothetical protein
MLSISIPNYKMPQVIRKSQYLPTEMGLITPYATKSVKIISSGSLPEVADPSGRAV